MLPHSAGGDHGQLPTPLRSRPQWMGTRFAQGKDGKVDKPPYQVRQGQRIVKADKTNPANWATYEEALAAYERREVDGIGYAFAEGDPFFVVDCDGVVDPGTGEVHPAAAQVIHALASYTELSCSGTGLHTIGCGVKGTTRCRTTALGFGIEVYDRARFVVLTGNRMGVATTVEQRQQELDALCGQLWPQANGTNGARQGRAGQHASVADGELLERARRAKTGPKFRALFDHGDTSHNTSASEADYSLLNMLIFWCAGDRQRVIDLFKASALYREDKGSGYVELSVDNALASYVGSFYRPRSVEQARQEEPEDPLTPYVALLLDPAAWQGRRAASAYKAYAGVVIEAAEYGITDEDGNLRVGADVRRLAEVAGTRAATLSTSALPYLVQEAKLVRWQRGKGTKAGVFVLPKPECGNRNIKDNHTSFSVTVSTPPQTLETLRLLIRMRTGYAKGAKMRRLGMPAMFVAVALTAGGARRGQRITELGERTGRSKRDLRSYLARLKAAGIAREVARDVYRLSDSFTTHYEEALEHSGITYAEREQRRRHAQDRERRAAKFGTDKQGGPLYGKERNARNLEQRNAEARQRTVEEQRQKVGTTAATFLADELRGVAAMSVSEMRQRWAEQGGDLNALWYAIQHGPFRKYREVDGTLCVGRAERHAARSRQGGKL